jgi:hypothetical protein
MPRLPLGARMPVGVQLACNAHALGLVAAKGTEEPKSPVAPADNGIRQQSSGRPWMLRKTLEPGRRGQVVLWSARGHHERHRGVRVSYARPRQNDVNDPVRTTSVERASI